jgi:molecular chaperone DnaK (HSP70)
MKAELLVSGAILSVVLSAVFAAVFNPLPPKAGVVGIDLGTTYSVISLFHNGSVEVVADDLGKVLTPSIVAFTPKGVLVGYPAKEYGVKHPEAVVFDAKRLIGHRFDEDTVQHDKDLVPFEVVDVNGSAYIRVDVLGKSLTMSPQSVGAHVLRKLKQQVEKHIQRPVQKAVLAVPADFTEEQRNATRDAGIEAGLDVLRIISEPTAAALAYGLQRRAAANIIVYDFGGGTLDVSLLNLDGGVFEVLALPALLSLSTVGAP